MSSLPFHIRSCMFVKDAAQAVVMAPPKVLKYFEKVNYRRVALDEVLVDQIFVDKQIIPSDSQAGAL